MPQCGEMSGPEKSGSRIGQQALEIDFLAGALGRVGDASAKR